MARQKKDSSAAETTELLVSVEQFVRTRDSVIVALTNLQTGLAHVQNGLNDLLRAYMTHTASILAGEGGTLENLQLPPHIAANATAAAEAAQTAGSAIAQAITAPAPAAGAPAGATAAASAAAAAAAASDPKQKKRKREKKTRDPNAPKRPLTAAFLFAQSARPIVKQDLEAELEPGQKLEPNAVNLEVTKRWNEMAEEDKEKWRQSYRESLEKWKLESQIYKNSGLAAPFAEDDAEPSDEAEGGALDSEAEVEVEVESEDEEESGVAPALTKETTPPAAAAGKTPRPNKRQKMAQVNGSGHVAIAPALSALAASPTKQTPIHPPGAPAETPAPKDKRDRKKKAAPQAIAPAPVVQPDATPEDPKKKAKSGRSTRNAEVEVEAPVVVDKAPKKSRSSKRKSEAASA